uniref:Guanine nucleotide-binding protein subunit gamma n=1 Tax=Serinus canaria TaxID=9135 RepID=A0A8C9MM47_SERCA
MHYNKINLPLKCCWAQSFIVKQKRKSCSSQAFLGAWEMKNFSTHELCAPRKRTRKNKMKELVSNSTTSISQARKAVEQLKMEAYMDRIKVSKAAADLLAYCDAHIGEDPLIIPVPASENPFREKKLFCTIL